MSTNPLDYVRRSDGNVTVEAGEMGETFTGASLGCLRGDLTTSDGYTLTEADERNWCRDLQAAVNAAVLGGRTIEVSGELDMIPSDTAFASAVGWYKNKTPFLLRIVYTDDQASAAASTVTDLFEVVFTQFDRTAPFDGTVFIPFTIRVQAIRSDMVIDAAE